MIDLSTKFYGGFQNTFSYKGLQLDFLFSFVKKTAINDSYFGYEQSPGIFNAGMLNQLASISNNWKKPGDISSIQKFTSTFSLDESFRNVYESDAVVFDASYIRLKNVSLSWELPERWINGAQIKYCSLFIQGQNLLTITGYKGLDPESERSFGLPPLRVITLGVKVEL